MKKRFGIVFCVLSIIFAPCVFAEYYQWTDPNGVRHFTDNILDIPKAYRPDLEVHQSIQSRPQDNPAPAEPDEKETATPENLPQDLAQKRQALEKEYETLMKKRQDLLDRQETMNGSRYREQTELLNSRILEFRQKTLDYDAQVLEYNQQKTKTSQ